jgi:large subunit ribosomal protein L15
MLVDRGLIASRFDEVKVLGDGDVPHALKVTAHRFSASAEAKILAAGGAVLRATPT